MDSPPSSLGELPRGFHVARAEFLGRCAARTAALARGQVDHDDFVALLRVLCQQHAHCKLRVARVRADRHNDLAISVHGSGLLFHDRERAAHLEAGVAVQPLRVVVDAGEQRGELRALLDEFAHRSLKRTVATPLWPYSGSTQMPVNQPRPEGSLSTGPVKPMMWF